MAAPGLHRVNAVNANTGPDLDFLPEVYLSPRMFIGKHLKGVEVARPCSQWAGFAGDFLFFTWFSRIPETGDGHTDDYFSQFWSLGVHGQVQQGQIPGWASSRPADGCLFAVTSPGGESALWCPL